jgi:aminoglycoside 3'-phosphotransferase-2
VLAGAAFERVHAGMSGARVYRVVCDGAPLRYLKTAAGAAASALREEIVRTRWLHEHGAPVPTVLRSHDDGRTVALLMGAVAGMRADESDLPTARLTEAIGRALAALHALPSANCPFDETLAIRLARAKAAVTAGEIDAEAFDPRNQHISPVALLRRLVAETPEEDLVVAHGDATLANMMATDDLTIGFVDCGHAGRADRYLDLGVTAADIRENFGERFIAPFARGYGIARIDVRKATFFSDLYEFF